MNPFLKWVVIRVIARLLAHELAAFTDGSYSVDTSSAADPLHIQRLQVRYRVVRTGLEDDVFENVLHFINVGGELPGAAATDTQKAAVETAFGNFWTAVKSNAPSTVKLHEYRWYSVQPPDPLTGPPTRITLPSEAAGTGTDAMPAQIATSITMRTALRKHWGRIYVPTQLFTTGGFHSSTYCDLMAAQFRTFINACFAADIVPVVYSKDFEAVFSIAAVEVDNVADVVRRRRPHASTYKRIYDTAT